MKKRYNCINEYLIAVSYIQLILACQEANVGVWLLKFAQRSFKREGGGFFDQLFGCNVVITS
jgi:hypothetical protein